MPKEVAPIPPMPAYDEAAFLSELEPTAAKLLNTHLGRAKEWFPHEFVPWSLGRDFTDEDPWTPDELPLEEDIRSALLLNLLTEDNLPYYFRTIRQMFGGDDTWGNWAGRWTAEEGRHAIVIRDYLTVIRALDPVVLERARMRQVSGGIVPEPENPAEGMVYVTLQELATRIAHRNTGVLFRTRTDRFGTSGYAVMQQVAIDENLHYLFYRGITQAAIELNPSLVVLAIERQIRDFKMPGTGVDGYHEHAKRIAKAGIYNLKIHHRRILVPFIFKHMKLDKLEGLTPEAEASRARIIAFAGRIGAVAAKLDQPDLAQAEHAG